MSFHILNISYTYFEYFQCPQNCSCSCLNRVWWGGSLIMVYFQWIFWSGPREYTSIRWNIQECKFHNKNESQLKEWNWRVHKYSKSVKKRIILKKATFDPFQNVKMRYILKIFINRIDPTKASFETIWESESGWIWQLAPPVIFSEKQKLSIFQFDVSNSRSHRKTAKSFEEI